MADRVNHTEALELIDADYDADSDNVRDGIEDQRYRAGDQWTGAERREREREGRPCLTINHLGKYVDDVAGELRAGQFGINVFPVDSREDKGIAAIYEGLIRQIEYQSHAQTAYAHGAECAVGCATGHWRIVTAPTRDSPFVQEIKIERILDPHSVIWDAQATKIDRSDARRCWVTEWIHETTWKTRFPNAQRTLSDVPLGNTMGGGEGNLYWRRDDFVRIAEYWYAETDERTFVMLDTGQTFDITDVAPEEIARLRVQGRIVAEATQEAFKIKRRTLDGVDWLGDEEDWAGQYIPIVPVLGHEIAYDGKIIRRSLIRDAKDPQKLLNYWRSASAEAVGKQPKTPWTGTEKMFEGYEGYYAAANRTNVPYLPYKVDPEAPTQRPERVDPPPLPTAMLQQSQIAVDDMDAVTGQFAASRGEIGPERSGRAIRALQMQGDVSSFVYSDNFAAAMWRTGQMLIDLIPRIYDTERQIRILQPDDTEQYIPINQRIMSADGEEILVNDLSNRRFDVRVKAGQSYTTARTEAQEQMALALQSNPALWGVIGDLVFQNSDFPGAEEIAKRLNRTIPDQIKNDQPQQQQPDPMAEMLNRLAIAGQQAQVQRLEAATAKDMAAAQKTAAEVPQTVAETEKTVAETEGQEIDNEGQMEALEAGALPT